MKISKSSPLNVLSFSTSICLDCWLLTYADVRSAIPYQEQRFTLIYTSDHFFEEHVTILSSALFDAVNYLEVFVLLLSCVIPVFLTHLAKVGQRHTTAMSNIQDSQSETPSHHVKRHQFLLSEPCLFDLPRVSHIYRARHQTLCTHEPGTNNTPSWQEFGTMQLGPLVSMHLQNCQVRCCCLLNVQDRSAKLAMMYAARASRS